MLHAIILFAQKGVEVGEDVAKKVGKEGQELPFYQNPMFLVIGLMVLFFFVVILPAQRRQKREAENIMSNLKKNDEVVTASGIIGIVSHIKEGPSDEVTLKIDDNARIRVLKSSIVRIIKKEDATPGAVAPNTNIKPNA